jgi:uncharacterized protein with GYD domain
MRKITPGAAKDEMTYFFLIEQTEKGAAQSDSQRKKGMNDVTKAVRKEGGECHLFASTGAAYDYVSVITGISIAGAIRVAAVIEQGGFVKATLLPGAELFGSV